MSPKNKTSRAKDEQLFTKVQTATPKYVTGPIQAGGQTLTPVQLTTQCTTVLKAAQDLDAARIVVNQKLQAYEVAVAMLRELLVLLKLWVEATYGKTSPVLAEFGWTPAKSRQKSAATKAQAVAKAKATRVARHTQGPRQKAKIHGDPASPAPQAAPPPANGTK